MSIIDDIKNIFTKEDKIFYAPIKGQISDIKNCNDLIFSEQIVGPGALIIADEGKVYAPCDGKVTMVAHGNHAVVVSTKRGIKVLVHVGIGTVELEGKYFKPLVSSGQEVKKGDALLEFDLDAIREAGYSLESPIVITNPTIKKINLVETENVEVGDELFSL